MMGLRRAVPLAMCVALALAGCADDEPAAPQSFAPLSFAYLRPLRLNVASVRVDDGWAPGAGDLGAGAPEPPVVALRQMAQDRLVAVGAGGQAVFTIEDAELRPQGDSIAGLFKVRVDITTSDGRRAAFAEAGVARSVTGPERQADMPAALYGLVKQMMADMNVELEFQLRRSVGDWLVAGAGVAPPPVAVQQQALPPVGNAPTAATGASSAAPTRYRLVPVGPSGTPTP